MSIGLISIIGALVVIAILWLAARGIGPPRK